MDTRDKTEILDALRRGQQAFLDALDGLPEDLAATRPGPGRWSALECAEHVAAAEAFMLELLRRAEPAATPMANPRREAAILARGADRTRPWVSPEAVRPAGRFATLADAVQHFTDTRAETVRLVENCNEDLRAKVATHPLLGPANGYEILLLMAASPLRHAQQIDEIRAVVRRAPHSPS